MRNEHLDPSDDHIWACRQTSGTLGEIQNYTVLSSPQVEAITADSAKMQEVCPGGEVVCNTCEIPFGQGAVSQAPKSAGIDFAALKADLVASTPVASGKQS